MSDNDKKFSNNQILEIVISTFLAFLMLFLFIKILFF